MQSARQPAPGWDSELLSFAQVLEPIDDRRTVYAVDDVLVSTWTDAVSALSENADAPLPNNTGPIDPGGVRRDGIGTRLGGGRARGDLSPAARPASPLLPASDAKKRRGKPRRDNR